MAKRKADRNSLASNEIKSRQKKRKTSHKKKEENSDEIHVKTVKNLAAQLCAVDERFFKLLQPLQDTFRRKFEAASLPARPTPSTQRSGARNQERSSEDATGPKLKGTSFFWYRCVLDFSELEAAWESFSSSETIAESIGCYDTRVMYLLQTDPIQQDKDSAAASSDCGGSPYRRFLGHFAARSLAIALENWEAAHGETTEDEFVRAGPCRLQKGAVPPPDYEFIVGRVVLAVSRGTMARTLERCAKNSAASLFVAWSPWQFETSVGVKGIDHFAELLQCEPEIVDKLWQWKESIQRVQAIINQSFRRQAVERGVWEAPSACSPTPTLTRPDVVADSGWIESRNVVPATTANRADSYRPAHRAADDMDVPDAPFVWPSEHQHSPSDTTNLAILANVTSGLVQMDRRESSCFSLACATQSSSAHERASSGIAAVQAGAWTTPFPHTSGGGEYSQSDLRLVDHCPRSNSVGSVTDRQDGQSTEAEITNQGHVDLADVPTSWRYLDEFGNVQDLGRFGFV